MMLFDLIDIVQFNKHLTDGNISMRAHPKHPDLRILNYTHKAAREQKTVLENHMLVNKSLWGDGTIDYCRGLIFDARTGDIIARPFKKFHNLNTQSIPETMEDNLPLTEPTITEKYDGSLGIFYEYRNEVGIVTYGIASRGSFESDQAKWATNWLKTNGSGPYDLWTPPFVYPKGHTLLFEIIYPENRIVIDYHGCSGLILLSVVNNETGEELSWEKCHDIASSNGLEVATKFSADNISEVKQFKEKNFEGFVISYSRAGTDPLKVKVKLEEYVRLHRIVTGLNPRSVWECLSEGEPLPSGDLPANFVQWLDSWKNKLLADQYEIASRAQNVVRDFWMHGVSSEVLVTTYDNPRLLRAEAAKYFQANAEKDLQGVLWAIYDKKNYGAVIWKMIEPRGDDKSFKVDHDE